MRFRQLNGNFAFERALRAERLALAEYDRVQRIFIELVMEGKVPDEGEWLGRVDSAREMRESFIPDFSNWKNHDAYQKALERLLRDLKADGKDKDTGQ